MKRLFIPLLIVLFALPGLRGATVDFLKIESPYLKGAEDVVVVAPDTTAGDSRRFPTVYLLNGYTGDHMSWLNICSDLPALADRYGFVFVCPDGRDSWYWDSPEDPEMQMESFVTKTLVPYIDANYPTIPRADQRAISGLSMGGQGALWLGIRHQDLWRNVGSTSGAVDIRPFSTRWKMAQRIGSRDAHPDVWEQYCVMNLLPTLKPGDLNIITDCGREDFVYDVNVALDRELTRLGIPHDFTQRPGGHSVPYWRNALPYHLVFFDRAFKATRRK